jgi:plasmid stability protein
MAYNKCMQYTVRGIPDALDKALRQRAREEGKSLNEVTVETLAEGLGIGEEAVPRRDLSDITGTWKREASVEAALKAQDAVDEELWK